MKKTIFINARFLSQPISGVQRFAIEISKELKRIDYPFVFLSPKNILDEELAIVLDVKVIGVLKGHMWEQVELQSYVLLNSGFLVSFCNTAPLFLRNQIVTVHDLCFRIYPDWFSKSFSLVYNFMIPKICKNAAAIITVSEASKDELKRELGVSDEKVVVLYNAVAEIFTENISLEQSSPIDCEFVLTVSSHHPRKNFNRLIEGFKLINRPDLKLCIIGNMYKNFNSEDIKDDERILYLQNIEDLELLRYYKHAKLFVFPSLYEGFGIPILEAMQFSVPVCVSDIPVFHEICNDKAVYFNPTDVDDIKAKIIESLEFPKSTNNMNLMKFSWKEGASKLFKLINRVSFDNNRLD